MRRTALSTIILLDHKEPKRKALILGTSVVDERDVDNVRGIAPYAN